jgi:enterochelin esterase-like enzyme
MGRSELLETPFHSASLEKRMPIVIYLPPGYFDSERRYPVLYMLSGFNGDPREWVNYGLCDATERLIRNGDIQPMIVVMPDGDKSWWFNHARVPGSAGKPYGDYVWKDIVSYVDANYRTLAQRSSRAIGGLSAGGQGAFMFGLTHPEIFGVVGAHSPSLRHADGSLAFFGDQEYFNQHDPLWLLRNTTTWKDLTFWVDVAHEDDQWGQSVHEFRELLVSLGIPHEFQDSWHGIHDGYYWGAHVGDYMIWYAAQLAGQ